MTAGAWGTNRQVIPACWIEYDDATTPYLTGIAPVISTTAPAYSSGSTPDEYAFTFTPAAAIRIVGVHMPMILGGNFDLVLYDSASTELATRTFNSGVVANAAASKYSSFRFASAVTLTAGSLYRVSLKASGTITIRYWTMAGNAALGALPGGNTLYMSTRVNAGAWTNVNARILAGQTIGAARAKWRQLSHVEQPVTCGAVVAHTVQLGEERNVLVDSQVTIQRETL